MIVRIVDAFNLTFFDLLQIENPIVGRSLLVEFLNGNPKQYRCDISNIMQWGKESVLSRYESGGIFVLVSSPRMPVLKYEYIVGELGKWITQGTHLPPMFTFSIERIAQRTYPPARIEPKGPPVVPIRSLIEEFIPEKKDKCKDILVTEVVGPKEITIGKRASYIITSYSERNVPKECKKKIKWKVEVYANCNSKNPTRNIDDCSTVPSVFEIKNDMLIIKKVPDFWFCCMKVYPYIKSPSFKVQQISKIKGKMKPILIGKTNHKDIYDKKIKENNGISADLECGDMTDEEFEKFYKKVCSIDCDRRFEYFINRSDSSHFESFEALLRRYSIGDLEIVTMDILKKMKQNKLKKGEKLSFDKISTYSHPKLNERAKEYDTDSDDEYQKVFFKQISDLIKNVKGDISKLDNIGLKGKPAYTTGWENIGGLGIIAHDTEAYEVNLIGYECLENNKFKATIKVKIYDNFGLDKYDISSSKSHMSIEPYKFLSWFYLQRVRGYKPFITIIEYEDTIEGEL